MIRKSRILATLGITEDRLKIAKMKFVKLNRTWFLIRAVMPIDTNIFRVVNRIGFMKGRDYEKTRMVLERLIPSKKLRGMHLLLIRFGREICKSRKPLCTICPINALCDYPEKGEITQSMV